ncbi:MAG: glycosyltransferase [Flavobacteriales bacterium]|nr:glycosyltransferase [Flavobacteriales bacterium]
MIKKVLIITYYWPPSGGAGVQRWLKFVKYLREYGWEPVVFTVEGGEVPVLDYSLKKDIPDNVEVLREPIWEPYTFYKKIIGQKKEDKIQTGFLTENKKPKLMERFSIWVRGNLFIPDARKFWIKPSVKNLSNYLNENKVDAIVSNGPPHTTHMIGLALKNKFNIPWLADFRDPWTNIDFYDKLMLSKWADKKHHRLEDAVIKHADALVTVSPNWAKDFKDKSKRDFNVIYNGFDEKDFTCKEVELDQKFSIVHIGSMNKDRNPHNLWKVLGEICSEIEGFSKDLEIKMVGPTDIAIKKALHENNLNENLNKIDYVPHSEVVTYLLGAQLLLLPINDTPNSLGVIPGKLFEYLAARRPIICIGPLKGDSCRIINETEAGYTFSFNNKSDLKTTLISLYNEFTEIGKVECSSNSIEKFSRRNLTGQMADLLNEIV